MSAWSEVRNLIAGSTWFERIVVAYCLTFAVVEAVRGDWSHAATYLLAASLGVGAAVNRQDADAAWGFVEQWKRMFYDLRDRQSPRDAGHATVGHALGVVLVLGAFLLLLGLAGAVEGGAW